MKILRILVIIVLVLVILPVYFNNTPSGKAQWNNWFHAVQVADDFSNYETLKKVEDTCRSMIASYNADKLVYEQYNGSESKEEQSWAEQAKIRANRTASTYNNYCLQNRYIWRGNIPNDIYMTLNYIE